MSKHDNKPKYSNFTHSLALMYEEYFINNPKLLLSLDYPFFDSSTLEDCYQFCAV